MRAISLFSGVGGFEIGFERAGIQTVLQAESDPWCLRVLEHHYPDTERVTDVREVDARALRGGRRYLARAGSGSDVERLGSDWRREPRDSVDLIYGGFPCQDVSVAGKRAGFQGERSSLWHEFHRVLRELRPRWCVIENVPGLLSSNSGRDFATVLLGLEELGYGWAYRILDARFFGVPQRRRRVFIVGCFGDAARAAQVLVVCEGCGGHPAPSSQTRQDVAFTLAGGSPETSRRIGNAWNTTYLTDVARSQTSRNERIDAESENFIVASAVRASDGHHGHSSPRGDGADNLIAQTLSSSYGKTTASGGSHGTQAPVNVVHGAQGVRRLTPLECERLMAFPDDWTRWTADGQEVPDSHRYRMCGNGVVSTVAEWIGHRVMATDRFLAEERVA